MHETLILFRTFVIAMLFWLVSGPAFSQYRRLWYKVEANAPLVSNTKRGQLIATDSRGNCYLVANTARGRYDDDIQVVKFNTEGIVEWVRWVEGTARANDHVFAMAVDRADNLVLAGYLENTTGRDAVLAKFSPAGEQVFIEQTNGRLNRGDEWRRLVIGPENRIHVIGAQDFTGGGTSARQVLETRSATGALLWSREFDGLNSPLATNALLTMRPYSTKEGRKVPGDTTKDIVPALILARFDGIPNAAPGLSLQRIDSRTGRVLSTRAYGATQFAAGLGTFMSLRALHSAPSGELTLMASCTTASGLSDTDPGACVIRFDATNSIVWTNRFEPANEEGAMPNSMVVDPEGNSYIGGINYARITPGGVNGFVARISNTGRLSWQFSDGRLAYLEGGLLLDERGTVVAVGRSDESGASRSRLCVISLDPATGRETLIDMLDASDYEFTRGVRFASHNTSPNSVAVTPDGRIVVAGSYGAPAFAGNLLVKYRWGKL